jgi:polyisoprenoid-binding protein YceI
MNLSETLPKNAMKMKRSLIAAASLLLAAFAIEPPVANLYQVGAGSEIWLEGRSTVDRFTCHATDFDGSAEIRGEATVRVNLAIPVKDLDCGRRRMNSDLQDALQADKHPEIRFSLIDVKPEKEVEPGLHRLRVTGTLTMAGAQRRITFIATGRQDGSGRLAGTGSVDLKMTDFGIDPPSALLGLVRAHDDIRVRFNLVAVVA